MYPTLLSLILVYPLLSWAGNLNDDSPLQKMCQKYLLVEQPYTLNDVRNFVGRPMTFRHEGAPASDDSLTVFTHPFIEALYFLEPPDLESMDPVETRDAIEYAAYLKTKNQGFIFVPQFMGTSVPDFDGIVFDLESGHPLFNVSLKHASRVIRPMTAAEFSESLSVWSKRDRRRNADSPQSWFRAINNPTRKEMLLEGPVVGVNRYTRFKILALAFGLFYGPQRPMVTVRDLSDRGISFGLARGPEFRPQIEAAIRADQEMPLVAIWDRHHVWEFPLQ